MDTMASFSTYFHQEGHKPEEQFLGVPFPHRQHTIPSGDPGNCLSSSSSRKGTQRFGMGGLPCPRTPKCNQARLWSPLSSAGRRSLQAGVPNERLYPARSHLTVHFPHFLWLLTSGGTFFGSMTCLALAFDPMPWFWPSSRKNTLTLWL